MSISALSGTQPAYTTTSISNNQNADRDGDNDGSGVKGIGDGRHHHGGGAFMQSVMQALQGMGLNVPSQAVNSASGANSANSNSNQSSTSPGTTDPRQALHTFLHDLRQALHQLGSQPTTTPQTAATTPSKDSDGDNDNSGPTPTSQSNRYNTFNTNLNSLISMLGNSSANTTSPSNPSIGGKLQADFTALTQALGTGSTTSAGNTSQATGTSSTTNATQPDLLAFLKTLESNFAKNSGIETGPGSIVSTSV